LAELKTDTDKVNFYNQKIAELKEKSEVVKGLSEAALEIALSNARGNIFPPFGMINFFKQPDIDEKGIEKIAEQTISGVGQYVERLKSVPIESLNNMDLDSSKSFKESGANIDLVAKTKSDYRSIKEALADIKDGEEPSTGNSELDKLSAEQLESILSSTLIKYLKEIKIDRPGNEADNTHLKNSEQLFIQLASTSPSAKPTASPKKDEAKKEESAQIKEATPQTINQVNNTTNQTQVENKNNSTNTQVNQTQNTTENTQQTQENKSDVKYAVYDAEGKISYYVDAKGAPIKENTSAPAETPTQALAAGTKTETPATSTQAPATTTTEAKTETPATSTQAPSAQAEVKYPVYDAEGKISYYVDSKGDRINEDKSTKGKREFAEGSLAADFEKALGELLGEPSAVKDASTADAKKSQKDESIDGVDATKVDKEKSKGGEEPLKEGDVKEFEMGSFASDFEKSIEKLLGGSPESGDKEKNSFTLESSPTSIAATEKKQGQTTQASTPVTNQPDKTNTGEVHSNASQSPQQQVISGVNPTPPTTANTNKEQAQVPTTIAPTIAPDVKDTEQSTAATIKEQNPVGVAQSTIPASTQAATSNSAPTQAAPDNPAPTESIQTGRENDQTAVLRDQISTGVNKNIESSSQPNSEGKTQVAEINPAVTTPSTRVIGQENEDENEEIDSGDAASEPIEQAIAGKNPNVETPTAIVTEQNPVAVNTSIEPNASIQEPAASNQQSNTDIATPASEPVSKATDQTISGVSPDVSGTASTNSTSSEEQAISGVSPTVTIAETPTPVITANSQNVLNNSQESSVGKVDEEFARKQKLEQDALDAVMMSESGAGVSKSVEKTKDPIPQTPQNQNNNTAESAVGKVDEEFARKQRAEDEAMDAVLVSKSGSKISKSAEKPKDPIPQASENQQNNNTQSVNQGPAISGQDQNVVSKVSSTSVLPNDQSQQMAKEKSGKSVGNIISSGLKMASSIGEVTKAGGIQKNITDQISKVADFSKEGGLLKSAEKGGIGSVLNTIAQPVKDKIENIEKSIGIPGVSSGAASNIVSNLNKSASSILGGSTTNAATNIVSNVASNIKNTAASSIPSIINSTSTVKEAAGNIVKEASSVSNTAKMVSNVPKMSSKTEEPSVQTKSDALPPQDEKVQESVKNEASSSAETPTESGESKGNTPNETKSSDGDIKEQDQGDNKELLQVMRDILKTLQGPLITTESTFKLH